MNSRASIANYLRREVARGGRGARRLNNDLLLRIADYLDEELPPTLDKFYGKHVMVRRAGNKTWGLLTYETADFVVVGNKYIVPKRLIESIEVNPKE